VPDPHQDRISNTGSRPNRECCYPTVGGSRPVWAALGPRTGGAWGTATDSRGQRTQRSAAGSQPSTWTRNPWSALSHGSDRQPRGGTRV
jgi:hypothetical protein